MTHIIGWNIHNSYVVHIAEWESIFEWNGISERKFKIAFVVLYNIHYVVLQNKLK